MTHESTERGPVRPIARTVTQDGDGYFHTRVDDGQRGYSSVAYTQEEAFGKIAAQTDTLIVCQLWDTVPGLQWAGQAKWDEALESFKAAAV